MSGRFVVEARAMASAAPRARGSSGPVSSAIGMNSAGGTSPKHHAGPRARADTDNVQRRESKDRLVHQPQLAAYLGAPQLSTSCSRRPYITVWRPRKKLQRSRPDLLAAFHCAVRVTNDVAGFVVGARAMPILAVRRALGSTPGQGDGFQQAQPSSAASSGSAMPSLSRQTRLRRSAQPDRWPGRWRRAAARLSPERVAGGGRAVRPAARKWRSGSPNR